MTQTNPAAVEHKVYTTLNTEGYHSSCPCGWTAYAPALYESAVACAEHEDYVKEMSTLADQIAPPMTGAEHRTTTRQLPGGPIEVRCSCGQWGGVAPSYPAAEKSATQHRDSAR